jgi:carbon-monoxide dehydrogenase small subunit
MSVSSSPMNETYSLNVNGRDLRVEDAWLGESLLYVLRERLGLPGAKGACEQGECGSCTVIMDGRAVCSCLVLAAAATESTITTVESLGENGRLSDVQQAFLDAGGVQCGFCTPGFIVAVHHLLEHNLEPSDDQIKEALSGNICRCTGYGRILDAVKVAARVRRGSTEAKATKS